MACLFIYALGLKCSTHCTWKCDYELKSYIIKSLNVGVFFLRYCPGNKCHSEARNSVHTVNKYKQENRIINS